MKTLPRLLLAGATALCALTFLPGSTFAQTAPATQPTPLADSADAALAQIMNIRPPQFDPAKREDATYVQKYMADYQAALEKRMSLARQFAAKYPDNAETPNLLLFVAQMKQDQPQEQIAIYRQIVKKYPDSDAAKQAAGPIRQMEAVGKPFELSFKDAISGKAISMKDLKGKVVVVDFWATWCGPCVGEMPHNKEIYNQFKDKGVEFIGVSLDNPEAQGGLDKLKEFVAKNDIKWPQYYQGNGWESDFSRSWGINSIPTVFIVDADGKLFSTEARGQLEKLIPQLLAKRDGKSSAAQ